MNIVAVVEAAAFAAKAVSVLVARASDLIDDVKETLGSDDKAKIEAALAEIKAENDTQTKVLLDRLASLKNPGDSPQRDD